jgi:hypothetical protein
VLGDFAEQDHEFFAAEAGNLVGFAQRLRDQFAGPADYGIARGMAVLVVHALKMVDIDDERRNGAAIALVVAHRVGAGVHEGAAVQ